MARMCEHERFELVVVGGGVAGLYAALSAAAEDGADAAHVVSQRDREPVLERWS